MNPHATPSGRQRLTADWYVEVKMKLRWGCYHGSVERCPIPAKFIPLLSDTTLLEKTHLSSFSR